MANFQYFDLLPTNRCESAHMHIQLNAGVHKPTVYLDPGMHAHTGTQLCACSKHVRMAHELHAAADAGLHARFTSPANSELITRSNTAQVNILMQSHRDHLFKPTQAHAYVSDTKSQVFM